ncbi:putative gustatory receptor 28a [Tribolium madens]|uniref:putative gustatory receptor 28a n=1 Tax=Tribolium madens TaxID=41895 RepID=UPI001CF72259|nr:putative gustatory receptor 28a [Tribolium madens]
MFLVVAELQSQIHWWRIIVILMAAVPYGIDSITVCDACYWTIEEATKSGELIHKIETESHDVVDEIEMFSLQIANAQVEFSAAGFFPINYTLVFSVCGWKTVPKF